MSVIATAGVRQVEREDQRQDILNETFKCLKHASGYELKKPQVITGEEEGHYAWLAVNYRKLQASAGSLGQTDGIVEIGGTSAQMAFLHSEGSTPTPTPIGIQAYGLGKRTLNIYSTSSVLGINEVKKPKDPLCNGCANYDEPKECVTKMIQPLLKEKGTLIGSEFLPPSEMSFVALANASYPIENVGLEQENDTTFKPTLKMVHDRVYEACGPEDVKEVARKEKFKKIKEKYWNYICFDSLFATQLAESIWRIRLENIRSLPKKKEPKDRAMGWPLGALMIEQKMIEKLSR